MPARSFLPYGHQWIFDDDIEAVISVLRSEWITQGPLIERFERAVAERCGARYAVAMSSGTAALHAACFAAGIRAGDEVITTPLSFVATANCALYQRGTPVFADVRPDTLTIDVKAIADKISRKTKAIIPMDYAGHPCDFDAILVLAKRQGLTVIEDAAHALGAVYRGRPVGALSDMTVFSFHPVKLLTTGEGGMVLTNSDHFYGRLRVFRTHGITRQAEQYQDEDQGPWYYEMQELGYNYRITDFQCGLGLSQLQKLDRFLARRQHIAARYTAAFSDVSEITLPVTLPQCESAWHLYIIRLNLERLRVGRGQIFMALRSQDIGVNVHYIPIPWHPHYRRLGYQKGQWPVAEAAYEGMLSLPIWPGMANDDVDRTVDAVRSVLAEYRK